MKQGGILFGLFAAVWVAALALPLFLFRVSPSAGAVTGVALPILWVIGMPCTCMKGGFAAFPMAVVEIASLFVWAGVGIHFLKAWPDPIAGVSHNMGWREGAEGQFYLDGLVEVPV